MLRLTFVVVTTLLIPIPVFGGEPLKASDFVSVGERLSSLEARVSALEAKLGVSEFVSVRTAAITVSESVPMVTPVATTRQAVGHTHTCRNGHTWDHTMDGGSHRCPFCGDVQYVVSGNRYVTGMSASPVYSTRSFSLPGVSYSSISSGCSGPGCSTGVTSRRGFFRR